MADAFVGLDIGTTGVKAVAFSAEREQLALATTPTPTHQRDTGGAEYDGNELWAAACQVLRHVTGELQAAGHTPRAIATASMGEAGVLIDEHGEPLAPIIAWFDTRTVPQAEWWATHVGVERTQAITGLTPRPVFGAAKMLWTKEHLPGAWAAGTTWLNMADWAAFKLSGQAATDFSLASRTMLFDVANRGWSDELLHASGLHEAPLAALVQSGETVGHVHKQAAAETGLPAGAVVGAGGQDHVCAALALDVTRPAMLLDSIGTAEAFFLVTNGFDATGRVAATGISQGAHVEPGRTYAMTGLAQGGGRIDQARTASGLNWPDFLQTAQARQVIDDVAQDGQERIELLLKATQTTTVEHVATGGGSRNSQLIDAKRAIGERPIEVASVTEATALGAALLAQRAHD